MVLGCPCSIRCNSIIVSLMAFTTTIFLLWCYMARRCEYIGQAEGTSSSIIQTSEEQIQDPIF